MKNSETPPMYEPHEDNGLVPRRDPPIFNIPRSVLVLCALLIAIHLASGLASPPLQRSIIVNFAFVPAFWSGVLGFPSLYSYLSPVTFNFLHADTTHLVMNLVWFVAFGSAVARRFGALRVCVFLAAGGVAAALAHFLAHPEGLNPVIGASGTVSACMGAAVRFAFNPLDQTGTGRALSLRQSFNNPTVLAFVGIWFLFNWLFGAALVPLVGFANAIAWEAHMGGFIFGLLAFPWFDRKG